MEKKKKSLFSLIRCNRVQDNTVALTSAHQKKKALRSQTGGNNSVFSGDYSTCPFFLIFSFIPVILDHSELCKLSLFYKLLTLLEIQGSSQIALGNFNLRLKQPVLRQSGVEQIKPLYSKGITPETQPQCCLDFCFSECVHQVWE